jgi:hypothetical protein
MDLSLQVMKDRNRLLFACSRTSADSGRCLCMNCTFRSFGEIILLTFDVVIRNPIIQTTRHSEHTSPLISSGYGGCTVFLFCSAKPPFQHLYCLNLCFYYYWAKIREIQDTIKPSFFFFGATAPIWALPYLHKTLRFTSVF